jgi:hypothetical protein
VPFRALLQTLVDRVPGARGAIFCDGEGEHVELAHPAAPSERAQPLSDYDLKICGAQMAATLLHLHDASAEHSAGELAELRVLSVGGVLLCRALAERYYLVLLLAPGHRSPQASRALAETARLVQAQM